MPGPTKDGDPSNLAFLQRVAMFLLAVALGLLMLLLQLLLQLL